MLPSGYQVNYPKVQSLLNASHHSSFVSFPSCYKVNPDASSPSCVSHKLNAVRFLCFKEQKTQVHCGSTQTCWWRVVVAGKTGMGGSSSWGLAPAQTWPHGARSWEGKNKSTWKLRASDLV